MKTVVLLGGGDWADASVDHLDIPDDMSVEEIKKEWRIWYDTFYIPNLKKGNKPKFKTVGNFMLEKGAVRSNIEEYEI